MFRLFKSKEEKELDSIIARIDSNMANNYKDNAQEALKELEERLSEIKLSPTVYATYSSILDSYKIRMKEFTHKDQKPYWT